MYSAAMLNAKEEAINHCAGIKDANLYSLGQSKRFLHSYSFFHNFIFHFIWKGEKGSEKRRAETEREQNLLSAGSRPIPTRVTVWPDQSQEPRIPLEYLTRVAGS